MTQGIQNFRGDRLKQARLARGLFKNALGDLIGVTGYAVARYEDGKDKPHQSRVEAMARQLKFPMDFFITPLVANDIELIHWRSRASESKSAREMTEQRIHWLCEVYEFLNDEVEFPTPRIPTINVPTDFNLITGEHIERAASELRAAWGLRNEPIPDMVLALENAGIPVVTLRISSDKQDGFCFFSNNLKRAFVGINIEEASCARARFDAAHELGHLILHRHVTPEQARTPASHKLIEQQAHRFAGAMLFPKSAFISEASSLSLDYFASLKKRWGISIAAMVMRAFQLGLIDDDMKLHLFRSMTGRKWRGHLREPYDDPRDMPLERPRMLRRGFEALLQAKAVSLPTLKAALPHPPHEIEELASLEPGFLQRFEAPDINVRAKRYDIEAEDLESGNVLLFKRRDYI